MRRRYLITAAVALAAAGITVGLTLATRTTPPKPHRQAGRPPLVLDFGVRTDAEAVALRRAADLYDAGKVDQAAPLFGRYRSLEAEVGSSLADWPHGFGDLASLARDHARSSLAQLAYGLALYWRGDRSGAEEAWRTARRAQPDTPYSLRAEDLLHPNFPRGLPNFVPSFLPPPGLARLSPPKQLAYLRSGRPTCAGSSSTASRWSAWAGSSRRRASSRRPPGSLPTTRSRRSRPPSAVSTRPTRRAPSRGSARLPSVTPRSQSVRFHLGLSLLWLGSVKKAKEELRLARDAGSSTPLGTEARRFLERLQGVGTG